MLLKVIVLGNLVAYPPPVHTRFTYHRTWETGLEPEIRVAGFNPAFFVPKHFFPHPASYINTLLFLSNGAPLRLALPLRYPFPEGG